VNSDWRTWFRFQLTNNSSSHAALRILTNLDRAALAAYCGAYALWADATVQLEKYGAMIKSPTGFPIQSPYLSIVNRQAEIMMRINVPSVTVLLRCACVRLPHGSRCVRAISPNSAS
jgi:hypothetical protein